MLWVDHENYYGPDRRRRRRWRWLERRVFDCAGSPPPLESALRLFRMRIIEAQGAGLDAFIDDAMALALLALIQDEPAAAVALIKLIDVAETGYERDVRPALYDALERVDAILSISRDASVQSG